MTPGIHSDGLRLQLAASDVNFMRAVGSIAGVVVLVASANNGPGVGQILVSTGGLIAWQAPGSLSPGVPQPCSADGTYMLEDGADRAKWIRISVTAAWLAEGGAAPVYITDSFNAFGPDDVSAANALAGITESITFALKNMTPLVINTVRAWLDPAVAHVTISSDGTNYYDPTSETDAHVLAWATIAPGAAVNLYLRRTIAAASASNPEVLNLMQLAWNGY